MRRIHVAAAMIVKNEAVFIEDCLRSVAAMADEIVVVDTGSTDGTPDLASRFGARVFHFDWTGDFAAARNFGLGKAAGNWILYIDADERIAPMDRRLLDAELGDPSLLACTVAFVPRTGFTAYNEYRLFRGDLGLRFEGAIHETMRPELKRRVAAGGGRIGKASARIQHIGYDGDQSHKLDRNETLLRRQIEADPERAYLWWHLGTVERDRGRLEAAEACWTQGDRLARKPSTPESRDIQCALELIKTRIDRGDDPFGLIEATEAAFPGDLMLLWLRAKAHVAAGQDEAALPLFERLARIDPETLVGPVAYDKRLFGRDAWAEMARCAFRLRRFEDSAHYARRAQQVIADEPSGPHRAG